MIEYTYEEHFMDIVKYNKNYRRIRTNEKAKLENIKKEYKYLLGKLLKKKLKI